MALDPNETNSQPNRSCFRQHQLSCLKFCCRQAERMAATDVARKLHAAGLVDNLHLPGEGRMAERANAAALSQELGWYASDPKAAAVDFAVSRSLDLHFDVGLRSRTIRTSDSSLLTGELS